jgi:hypothetical protein
VGAIFSFVVGVSKVYNQSLTQVSRTFTAFRRYRWIEMLIIVIIIGDRRSDEDLLRNSKPTVTGVPSTAAFMTG